MLHKMPIEAPGIEAGLVSGIKFATLSRLRHYCVLNPLGSGPDKEETAMRLQLLVGAALTSLALAMSSGSQASILFDGFESPALAPGAFTYGGTDAAGAVFGSGTGVQSNGSAFGYANAPEGVQTAHIQGQGSFTETVTGLVMGQTYALSFFDAARNGYGVDGIQISNGANVIFTGTPSSTSFSPVNLDFVYNGAGSIFTIAGTIAQGVNAATNPAQDFNAAIDGFAISAVSSVPEPGTWAMMLVGIGCLGVATRARRRQVAI